MEYEAPTLESREICQGARTLEALPKFVGWLQKIPISLLFALTCCTVVILFAPQSLTTKLYLDAFRDRFGPELGASFLLLIFIWVARGIEGLRQLRIRYRGEEILRGYLRDLTPEERGYLVPFIHDERNTVHAGVQDGIMKGLEAKRIVVRISAFGDLYGEGFPFNLQPWARKYLNENPHLLDGAIGRPVTPKESMQRSSSFQRNSPF